MTDEDPRVAIVGGGPAGSLLAVLLARRGFEPVVYERSAPFTERNQTGGRSINLALAARGIEALRRAGLERDVQGLMIAMRGRRIHETGGEQRFLAYGQRAHEQIYSVSRAALNTLLYRLASERDGVEYRFEHRCVGLDPSSGLPVVEHAGRRTTIEADVVFAADGAGSEVRRALAEAGAIDAAEELLDHGYKELTIPAGPNGEFALDPNALHIWPRGGFMLIALPNPDHTFTATLFLPHEGEVSFRAQDAGDVCAFFRREFPDVAALMPDLERDYASHPTGILGTVTCRPWSRDRLLLIGDAAHAIVPFHGQGMNAAFEDCVVLDRLLETALAGRTGPDPRRPRADRGRALDDGEPRVIAWRAVFADFERLRAPNTRAIAEMAVENYREMRDEVRDAKFELRAALSFELERRFPGRFVPRYSMVMFHPEISYAEAQRRGLLQARILRELTDGVDTLAEVDFEHAARLVERDL